MILIDGKKIAAELREELKQEVADLKIKYKKVPGLTVILIGDMTPSQIYVRNKEKSANEVGLKSEVIRYPDTVEEKTILGKIEELKAEKKAAKGERKEEIKRQLATCRDRKIGGGYNEGNTQKEKPNNNSNLKDNTMDSGDSGVNMNLGDNMTGDINISLPDTKNTDEDDNDFFLEVLEAQNDQVENINNITKLVEEKANSR